MNPVINTLREHIADQNIRFVFPSQVAADLWARKTCTLGIARSIAKNRFIAWDEFKEAVVQERIAGRKPATSLIRKLFAEALVQKNSIKVFFKSIIFYLLIWYHFLSHFAIGFHENFISRRQCMSCMLHIYQTCL